MKWCKLVAVVVAFVSASAWMGAPAADPPATGPLVIIDANGKEQKIKTWKFVSGTRRLGWLAPDTPEKPPEPDKDEPRKNGRQPRAVPAGPEALEFRDENSTTFVQGILTLITLDHIRELEFDNDKSIATLKVAGDKADISLAGTTKFRGINKISIECEVDKGDIGVAQLKFLGGVPKGIQAVRFPNPKAAEEVKGRPAFVTNTDQKMKSTQKVHDLQPLYRVSMAEKLGTQVFFKKTLKIDTTKITGMKPVEGGPDADDWQVTLKDGNEETLTLLRTVMLDDKPAALEGFVGKIPGGYKLFPLVTISKIDFDEEKKEEKKDEKKGPTKKAILERP
jgi:hypothetical protein